MQFSATKMYGAKDYTMAALLISLPFLFNFNARDARAWIPISLGGGALVYSLVTNYELGAVKLMSVSVHLLLDLLVGVFLAASPWIFGFHKQVFLPHLIMGLVEIGVALFTAVSSDVVKKDPWYNSLKEHLQTPALQN